MIQIRIKILILKNWRNFTRERSDKNQHLEGNKGYTSPENSIKLKILMLKQLFQQLIIVKKKERKKIPKIFRGGKVIRIYI